jgi:hypothetical protein
MGIMCILSGMFCGIMSLRWEYVNLLLVSRSLTRTLVFRASSRQ